MERTQTDKTEPNRTELNRTEVASETGQLPGVGEREGPLVGVGGGVLGERGTGRAFILCKTGSESSLGSAIVSALCCLRCAVKKSFDSETRSREEINIIDDEIVVAVVADVAVVAARPAVNVLKNAQRD